MTVPVIPAQENVVSSPPRAKPALSARRAIRTWQIALALALHALLGLVVGKIPGLAPVHALATAAVALWCATSDRSLVRASYAAAYIAGAEALWRITGANLVWEFGKYSMSGIMLVALVRYGRLQPYWPPILYAALLLPSALLTFTMTDLVQARQLVSFDLSGPMSLAVSVLFFHRVRLNPRQVAKTFLCYVVPSLATVTIILLGLSEEEVTFGKSSSAAASGGFGPNQISAALGLAGLFCFLIAINRYVPRLVRLLMGVGILAFAAQSALTFSRCGLYYLVGGMGAATLMLLRNRQVAVQLGLLGVTLSVVAYFILFPWLDAYTGGALSHRFKSTDLTNRDKIMLMDLQIFTENPILGIGVGRGKEVRESMSHRAASHTEYTRLLAEHGTLGLLAMALLGGMGLWHLRCAHGIMGRAFSAAMLAYAYLYLIANGMRQVLPAFTFGLAAATCLPDLIRKRSVPPSEPPGSSIQSSLPSR